ncbi:REP-associated tyrosine transposase [Aquipseudomonas guryensis]|jgi:putative transposase|uniref:Transposase n=1 Tax=Aquipseudomonas guryensis TaxID=2759165 RepID=A0A7W4DCR7_9GAMM|nr:transposase [Pseudomonas guryensis]MBB1520204.1 transposase [Pseudomonas guryensis]
MVNYRRARVAGACYFLTLALRDRSSDLLLRYSDELRMALRQVSSAKPFKLPAAVVLPEHLHLLMWLPEDDADFSSRVRMFKSLFIQHLQARGERVSINPKGEASIWQRRFWEHLIRDEQDFAAHVDYIHANPMKHGLVLRAADWPLSSFHRYVQRGLLPSEWCGGVQEQVVGAGE